MKLFNQYYPKFSFTILVASLTALGPVALSAETHARYAKPIGFQIIDQPPVVIEGNSSARSNAPVVQTQTARQAPVNLSAEAVVEGFADKVPLTVALQQILPQGYGYTLGDGVDPGQLVSWRGGRPWNVVMQEMLRPSGLSHSVNGRSVAINGNGAPPTVISGTPVPMQQQAVTVQPQAPVMMQQPVMQQPMMQPMPDQQMVMMQQPVMQQPMMQPMPDQQMMVMQQQPMMMQQPMMQPMPDQQMMMQQQAVMMPPQPMMMPPQAAAIPAPQPLQIENPLIFTPQSWEARPGTMLRALLTEWCARVGAELQWNAEYDYPVMASMAMTGTFEEAVRTLLTGFGAVRPTPQARLHYNPAAGQSVLIIQVVGNHYGE